ncbi:MAG: hypothetical protein JW820_13160 [Spirochaetales bacterium]|nr:hypothetical protein [Spirochaetales bacterium]
MSRRWICAGAAGPSALPALVIVLLALIGPAGPLAAEGREHEEYHGADSTFQAEGLALLWATLKGAREEDTLVCLQIVRTSADSERYRCFVVLAVDPFSGESVEQAPVQPLGPQAMMYLAEALGRLGG